MSVKITSLSQDKGQTCSNSIKNHNFGTPQGDNGKKNTIYMLQPPVIAEKYTKECFLEIFND